MAQMDGYGQEHESHADSSFFLNKEAKAKETIKKYGLPKDIVGEK
jgi:hypothetical protein